MGLTDNPTALRRWMMAGPEIARLIREFQDEHDLRNRPPDTRHHDPQNRVPSSKMYNQLSM